MGMRHQQHVLPGEQGRQHLFQSPVQVRSGIPQGLAPPVDHGDLGTVFEHLHARARQRLIK